METLPPPAVRLPMAAASARLARQHVQQVTGAPEDPRVAVVVTELVNNAVLHARSQPRLRVVVGAGSVTVEVSDDGPGVPELTPLGDDPAVSGRGLALVDALSSDWGVRPDPAGRGKSVWATVTFT